MDTPTSQAESTIEETPSAAMDTKQTSWAVPTIKEIENWDVNDLIEWIKKRHPKLLTEEDCKKLRTDRIDGALFLNHAGDMKYFEECNLARGTSERLANLASEIVGRETGMAQKGKEQDTGTGKSTDHAPLLFSLH
jgi:hypothetical protein